MNTYLNKDAMRRSLLSAKLALEQIIDRLERGELDDCEAMSMSYDFSPVLRNLCIAWHSKWMDDEYIYSGGGDLHDRMGSLVPNWGLGFDRLVDVDEPAEFDRRGQ